MTLDVGIETLQRNPEKEGLSPTQGQTCRPERFVASMIQAMAGGYSSAPHGKVSALSLRMDGRARVC